jgi:hypothetical protein
MTSWTWCSRPFDQWWLLQGVRPFQRDKYTLHDHLCLEWLEALPTPVWLLSWKSLTTRTPSISCSTAEREVLSHWWPVCQTHGSLCTRHARWRCCRPSHRGITATIRLVLCLVGPADVHNSCYALRIDPAGEAVKEGVAVRDRMRSSWTAQFGVLCQYLFSKTASRSAMKFSRGTSLLSSVLLPIMIRPSAASMARVTASFTSAGEPNGRS